MHALNTCKPKHGCTWKKVCNSHYEVPGENYFTKINLPTWMKVVFLKVETKYKEQQALYMRAIIDRFSQSHKACIIMLVKKVLQQLMMGKRSMCSESNKQCTLIWLSIITGQD